MSLFSVCALFERKDTKKRDIQGVFVNQDTFCEPF